MSGDFVLHNATCRDDSWSDCYNSKSSVILAWQKHLEIPQTKLIGIFQRVFRREIFHSTDLHAGFLCRGCFLSINGWGKNSHISQGAQAEASLYPHRPYRTKYQKDRLHGRVKSIQSAKCSIVSDIGRTPFPVLWISPVPSALGLQYSIARKNVT